MSVRRNIVANYAGQAYSSGLSLLLVPVYIRYLSIEAYALVGLFTVVQAWLVLLDLGMAPTLNREMARFTAGAATIQHIRDLLRSLELTVFTIAAVIAVILSLLSHDIAAHWLQPGKLSDATVASALSLIGIVVALRFSENIYRSALFGLQRQVWIGGAAVVLATLRGGGAVVVLAFVSPTIQAFFVWQALVSALTLLVFGLKLHMALPAPPRPARFSLDALRSVHRFAGGVFGISLTGVLLGQADKLLLSRLLGLGEFGYYMLAATLAGGLMLVGGPVVLAVYPALTRLFAGGDRQQLSATYHRTAQVLSVVLAPATLIIVAFPHGVLFAWSGDPALSARAAPVLALLTVGTFLSAAMQAPHCLQMAAGWTGLILRMNIAAVMVLIPALVLTVPIYGAPAAAACWAVLNLFYLLVGVPMLHRRLLRGEMWRYYRDDLLFPVLGAALIVGAAWLVRPAATDGRLAWLVYLAVVTVAGTVGSLAGAGLIRAQAIQAVRRRGRTQA